MNPNSTHTLWHLCAKMEDCTNSVSQDVLIMINQSSAIARIYAMYSIKNVKKKLLDLFSIMFSSAVLIKLSFQLLGL